MVHGRDNKAGEITEFDSFFYAQGGTKVSLSFIICGEKKHISLKRKERGREGRIDELKKKEKRQKYKMRCDLHIYVLF